MYMCVWVREKSSCKTFVLKIVEFEVYEKKNGIVYYFFYSCYYVLVSIPHT